MEFTEVTVISVLIYRCTAAFRADREIVGQIFYFSLTLIGYSKEYSLIVFADAAADRVIPIDDQNRILLLIASFNDTL